MLENILINVTTLDRKMMPRRLDSWQEWERHRNDREETAHHITHNFVIFSISKLTSAHFSNAFLA